MAVALTGIVGDLSNLIPSSSDILQQVIIGAGATTLLAGMKTGAGQDALDPLHLFHKDPPAAANNPNVVIGPTITASAFSALPAASQQMMMSNGAHVVAG
jgi:hypothetical protein